MKRKLLSILLTLCMVLTLLPTVALAEGETHSHCVCGATHSAVGNHTTDESSSITWQAWPESGLPTEGNYYLTDNVTISSQWKIENGKNIVLCLNGKTLTADNATVADTILIEGTLTITDCVGTGKITGTNTGNENKKAIQVAEGGTLNLYAGSITGINAGSGSGGGVHNRGTFNMYGGSITNNKAAKGGGVLNWGGTNPAIFNMYGGTISGNLSTNSSYTDGNDIYNQVDGGAQGVMNAYGGTVAGTVRNQKSTITTAEGYTGTTFNGAVKNSANGTISGGNYSGDVMNLANGSITGGNFSGDVTNRGIISGGSFTGAVTNGGANGSITGGTFNGVAYTAGSNDPDTSWYDGHESDSSFTISNVAQLFGLAALVNNTTTPVTFEGKTITLTNDIALAIANTNWTPIGNGKRSGSSYTGNAFKGTFDGNGKTISGLKIDTHVDDADKALGLFGVVDGGTVKNLTLSGVNITYLSSGSSNSKNTGAAIGLMVNSAKAEGITVSGTVTGADGVGGIVGRMTISGTIKNCVNNATVTSGAKAGGIVGAAYYTDNPLPHGTGDPRFTTIENCTNNGTVTSTTGYVGGIAGLSAAKVSGCINTGAVTGGTTSIGGIVGEQANYGSVTGCTNSGSVTNKNSNYGTGGIVGWVRYNGGASDYPVKAVISVTNNSNNGKVEGGSDAGGIVGMVYHAANVTGNENTATSLSSSDFVAGIVGGFQSLTGEGNDPVQGSSPYYGETIPSAKLNCTNNVSTTTLAQMNNGTSTCKDLYVYNNVAANTGTIGNNSGAWVATIGTAKYATLAAAADAAGANDTIALLKDVTLAETLSVPTGKTAVLDLSGKQIAAAEGVTIEGALAVCGSGKVHTSLKDYVTAAQGYCLSANANTSGFYDIAVHGTNCTSAVTAEPTYNQEGVRTYYCTHCGNVARTTPISRLILYVPNNNAGSTSGTDDGVNVQFSDVPTSAYYAAAVNWAVAQGITTGTTDTTFGPNLSCTRAQIVTFLYRCAVAQGVDVSVGADTNILSYADALEVPEYAFEAFQWACGAGIIQGSDGKLMPGDDCTRAQIVTMLYRYAVATGADVSVGADTNILSYADALELPEYAFEAFQWACGAGIIQGADGKLMPNGTCTRAQIVTMLYRANG